MKRLVYPVLLGMGFLLSCTSVSEPFEFPELPVYEVVDSAVTLESAKQFATSLGVAAEDLVDDNIIRYLDTERFGTLPMTALGTGSADEDGRTTRAEGFDFAAIADLEPYPEEDALARVSVALEVAGLEPEAGTAVVKHSLFEAVNKSGAEVATVQLDTQVVFKLTTPNGVDLKGPGAEVKVVFDPEGVVTQIAYALCRLREGERVPVQPVSEARRVAAAQVLGLAPRAVEMQGECSSSRAGTLCLDADVVYYAPPPALRVETILPHYLFSGTFFVEGESVPVRNILVPVNAVGLEVQLEAQTADDGQTVRAEAAVTGGTPPYRYTWVSSTTDLSGERLSEKRSSSSLVYKVAPRAAVSQETLSLIVTDANELTNWASETFSVDAEASSYTETQQTSARLEVGSQWIGLSQGLPGSVRNVDGLAQTMREGDVAFKFNFGDAAASKADFVDPSLGGRDNEGIDAVDLAFYTGHATGSGWTFEAETEGRFLFYDEARWGNQDLEWLVVAACGPLQTETGGLAWWQRWGGAFDGLHLLLGYANITLDNPYEGGLLGTYLLNGLTLRHAWILSATESQSPDETLAIMGVWGRDGVNNYNDHFWGQGLVGPDIPATKVEGFWRVTGPS